MTWRLIADGLAAAWTAAAAWSLTPTFVRNATAKGLLDQPSARKSHGAPVARVGGAALFVALVAGSILLAQRTAHVEILVRYLVLLTGAFAIGIADDRGLLRTQTKLAWQVLLAGVAGWWLAWAGEPIGPFGSMSFGWLSPFMTALWVFAVMTVVNFVDGIDLITVAVTSVLIGVGIGFGAGPEGGALYVAALGALLGVAFWNVSPARVFLGDAGTHVLGLLVAVLPMTVRGAENAVTAVPWALASAPLLACVLDIGLGIVNKVRLGVPVHAAHNDHVYQRITKAGRSHAYSAVRYGLLAVIGVALVAAVAPAFGLGPTFAIGGAVLLLHFGEAAWSTRAVPHEFVASSEDPTR